MAMPTIEVEPTTIVERKADSRGRVAIGPEFADTQVRVAVIETLDDDGADDESSENQRASG